MAFEFVGFDGNSYKCKPNLPSFINDYNYYLVFSYNYYTHYLLLFNDEITAHVMDDKIYFSTLDNSSFRMISCDAFAASWYDVGTFSEYNILASYPCTFSSENLFNYKDLLLTNNFTLPVPETEVSVFTLRPIVEEVHQKENFIKSSFDEIFSILPILIVVLVSFIGIRKGISFLISQINKT